MSNRPKDELSQEELLRIKALLDALGLGAAAEKLDVSRESLLRVLASTPVRRGTLALLRQSLTKLES